MSLSDRLKELREREKQLAWEGTFLDYFELAKKNPRVARLAHGIIYDMIMDGGVTFDPDRDEYIYHFFSNDIFGLATPLEQLVEYFKSAAQRLEVRKRILLMMGPVGGGKSTIVSLLKRGMEAYSRRPQGALYAIKDCPMHEEPLHLVPHELRDELQRQYDLHIEGDLCPVCNKRLQEEWGGRIEEVPVVRIHFSEKHRVGIGTFTPSDEKCVDSATLLWTPQGMQTVEEVALASAHFPQEGTTAGTDAMVFSIDGLRPATRVYNGGTRSTRRISTSYGYELACSNVHPVLARVDGEPAWLQARDVLPGAEIAVMVGADLFGTNRQMTELPSQRETLYWTPTVARVMGYLVAGEGSCEGRYDLGSGRVRRETQAVLQDLMPGELYAQLAFAKSGLTCNDDQGRQFLAALVSAALGTMGNMSASLRSAPRAIVLAFIAGLFLNGGVFSEDEEDGFTVAFETQRSGLLRVVQLALLNAGIISRRGLNMLKLSNDELAAFCTMAPELLVGVGRFAVEQRSAAPAGSASALVASRRLHRPFDEALYADLARGMCTDAQIRVTGLEPAAKIYWMPVVDITESSARVYDLTVPNVHSYCADGFVTHNSQDISELVGSVDLSTIGKYGTESDPRAYRFDGELNVANRGLMEFIEMLKAPDEFLYSLLTLSQEQSIKTGRFSMIYSDQVVVSHTNEAEYNAFVSNRKNEALKDRMILIKVPYNLRVSDEKRIYDKLLGESGLRDVHIAPNTLEIASTFAVLTRLEASKKSGMSLMKKLKLYDGQSVEGFGEKDVKELQDEAEREGMFGISPRYIINRLSSALVKGDTKCINPIDALRALKDGMDQHTSITREQREEYLNFIYETRKEYDEVAKNEVHKAFVYSFEESARTLFNNYLDNIEAFCASEKLIDPITDETRDPDEKLMRSIEEQIGITENAKRSFREEILIRISSLARRGKSFDYTSHERLREAIEKKLFADLRNVVKITTSTKTPDAEQLKRINEVVDRLISDHGYCPICANELVKYVGYLLNR